MSFCAASAPSICLSVKAICLMAGGGAAWLGAIFSAGFGLACAHAPSADTKAMTAARQAILNAVAAGRTQPRMGGSPRLWRLGTLRAHFGLGFYIKHLCTLKPCWSPIIGA